MRTSQLTGVSTFASPASPSTKQSLQKSFHLSYVDKIELKKISFPSENKIYATAQPDTTKTLKRSIDNGLLGRTTRTTGYNTVLAKKGLKEVIEQLCYYQFLCMYSADGFQIPLLRQYPKRCLQCYDDNTNSKLTSRNGRTITFL